ncbi:DUF6442 family protein [Miniphocaeibacter halophilus]|uniref:Uncharacterized protein n=1 Tax=Miniphocaeibacter halophilus TaxID=2931922 RepID=A0AC61MRT2_9FIRM|nr:DUF6442 family protein [Miniphocaeibacter halophilus]QQK06896.1 hypothetical protein JFY71_05975 [Miniphocaeibacter halophilus]
MKKIDKDEILKRARKESNKEYEDRVFLKAMNKSMVVVAILCLFFAISKLIFSAIGKFEQGIPFFEFIAVLLGCLSANQLFIYKKIKNKKYIISSVLYGIAFLANVIMYFIYTYKFVISI